MNFEHLTSAVLRRAAAIRDEMEGLGKELADILGGHAVGNGKTTKKRGPKPKVGGDVDEWRKRQAGGGGQGIPKEGKKRKMSAAGRARIAAAAKARWAKVKAAGKNSL